MRSVPKLGQESSTSKLSNRPTTKVECCFRNSFASVTDFILMTGKPVFFLAQITISSLIAIVNQKLRGKKYIYIYIEIEYCSTKTDKEIGTYEVNPPE